MEPRVELTFTSIEAVDSHGEHAVYAHVYFSDAKDQKYALMLGISETLWCCWGLGEYSPEVE